MLQVTGIRIGRILLVMLLCLGTASAGASRLHSTKRNPANSHPIARPEREQREILFLSSLDPDSPEIGALIEETETRILEGWNSPIHFSTEYLDRSMFAADQHREESTASYLQSKYQGRSFDLVVTIGGRTLEFAERYRAKLFPDAALMFYLVDAEAEAANDAKKADVTGVVRKLSYLPTLQLALQQNAGVRHVVVIIGSSEFEKLEMAAAHDAFRTLEGDIDFQYWSGLRLKEMRTRMASLPPNTVVVFLDFMADARGEQFSPSQVLRTVAEDRQRPIYGTLTSLVGSGIVGGSIADMREIGRVMGSSGLRILNGEKAEAIPVTLGEFQHPVFDWRELRRWNIGLDKLPPGNSVLHWQYSVWELYGPKIVGLLAILLIETVLIILLVHYSARRKRAEEALRGKEGELLEAERVAELTSWQWAPETDKVTLSKPFYSFIGIDPQIPVNHFKELSTHFTSESWARLTEEMSECLQSGKPFKLELEGSKRDGSIDWIGVSGEVVRDAQGQTKQMRGTMQRITERKLTEQRLRDSEGTLAGIVGSAMDAIITVNEAYEIVLFNAAAERMLGCSAQEAIGKTLDPFIPEQFRAGHSENIRQFGETKTTTRAMNSLGILRARRANGDEFPIEASIAHVRAGERSLFTVVIRDITERLQAEAALRESERRFRLVANSAPVMIWMSDGNKHRNYFNQPWFDFTGHYPDTGIGTGWMGALHPDDLPSYLEAFNKLFEQRLPFALEYRLQRHDGEFRWVTDRGVPRFQVDGSFAGYIGCCIDITDDRNAKATLKELSGRLLGAQEEERARIARELHDDISQRLALLANRLQVLNQELVEQGVPAGEQESGELWELTSEIAADIQQLSHDLHPSKLNYLGLAGAAREICHEFSRQLKMEIECRVQDLPRDLDGNISLGLFRIIQEALRNVSKHSHAQHAEVELTRVSGSIRLSISDDGVGFDVERLGYHGLGLVSMRERLRIIGGELSIWSRPSYGTHIEATVPVVLKQRQEIPADPRLATSDLPRQF
jgi:PAS domain S-box-containing protein